MRLKRYKIAYESENHLSLLSHWEEFDKIVKSGDINQESGRKLDFSSLRSQFSGFINRFRYLDLILSTSVQGFKRIYLNLNTHRPVPHHRIGHSCTVKA